MMPEQQWPENVRDAVRQVIHDQMPGMMCGPLGHEFVADAVLAALAPHVVPRGPRTEEWEWGVRTVSGWILRPTMTNEEGEARRSAIPEAGDKIVRRRPAGPWEEVDA